ncbi:alpha/beta hydrolase [soil metagenome]
MTTSDGQVLDADLADIDRPGAGVVVCHPHPQYGGSRHDQVVSALFEGLPELGISVLRFDFRRTYGHGIDERLDAVAALDLMAERLPDVPMHLVGYSFGAMVALGVSDRTPASRVVIAPPFPADPELAATGPSSGPILAIVPEHDQFCPPEQVRPTIDAWPDTLSAELATVEMADHFLAGRAAVVTELVGRWVLEHSVSR